MVGVKGGRTTARLLNNLTRKNKTRMVKSILNGYSLKSRQKIIHLKVNGRPLLFEATFVGNVKLVSYLLNECAANVEQTGHCEIGECTPLVVATSLDFFHVVVTLLEHGANVNFQSIGCHRVKMMRPRWEMEDEIGTHDCTGWTCLMYSIKSARICQLLLDRGAQVDQTDNKGRDALHFAILIGQLESVKVLVKNGADILRVGPEQTTPLELSAMACQPVLVEYMLGMNRYTNESRANAYELLGSKILTHDSTRTTFYWKNALQIRNQYNLFPKTVPEHRDHQSIELPLGKEFQTLDQLKEISIGLESMWTQALLIQFRVLGAKHPDTINCFFRRLKHYVSDSDFDRGIVLLKCLFLICESRLDPLPLALVEMIMKLRILAIVLIENDNSDIKPAHNLACLIARYFSTVGMDFVESLNPTDRQNKLTDVEVFLLEILSQLNYVLSFNLSEEQDNQLNATLFNLIRRQPRGMDQAGLLHLTISLKLSTKLLSRLVRYETNINWRDELGNTAVHYAIHRHLSDQQPDMLMCLLDHGCHVDIMNTAGDSPLEYLRQNGILSNPLSHITLQCMTAKVIKKSQLPYPNILPKSLGFFVDIH